MWLCKRSFILRSSVRFHEQVHTLYQTKAPVLLPVSRGQTNLLDGSQTMAKSASSVHCTCGRGRTHYSDAGDSAFLCTFELSASKEQKDDLVVKLLHFSKKGQSFSPGVRAQPQRFSDKLRLRAAHIRATEKKQKRGNHAKTSSVIDAAAPRDLTRPCQSERYYKMASRSYPI